MYSHTCTWARAHHMHVFSSYMYLYNTLLDILKLYDDAIGSAVSVPSHACTSYLPHCSQNQARYEWSRATRDSSSFFDNICVASTRQHRTHTSDTLSHLDWHTHAAVLLTRCVPAFFLSALGRRYLPRHVCTAWFSGLSRTGGIGKDTLISGRGRSSNVTP
jgi:hypothetical protein